ncbi:hypothetical protein HYH03_011171 [Edaphochlamys debaryana]|uniref:Protein kinase domain-containing protein n=1 Tax=Edaphochlamys debaryana TaxID=47281 RepID=A0A835Y3G6_9CHLO|nr:hypothetical protein HYH03_011171 [Edaphochlamys debaryana]|eukprot:KAG2490369.1 hypothetical protein HYH03_011171 [Edaphochlamys debaryana]
MDLTPQLLAKVSIEDGESAQRLIGEIAAVIQQQPSIQDQWDIWLWDVHRPCRAASYVIQDETEPKEFFMTTDRPCAWTITFLCMPEEFVLASGQMSSSQWYRQYVLGPQRPVASNWRLGPQASGLQLVSSDLVLGDPDPPTNITVAFNEADRFWTAGPVVAALYRSGNGKLLTLKPVRENETSLAWGWFNRPATITGAIGATNTSLDQGPTYEVISNLPNYDYIVAVQGCYRAGEVEMLFFLTRTGRQWQLGRGGCTTWFREDAPPGGYLAGFSGRYTNASLWAFQPPPVGLRPVGVAWINQLKLVWAAPAGSGAPNSTVLPPASPTPGACPAALPLASAVVREDWVAACGEPYGLVCPSNACCGGSVTQPSGDSYSTCATSLQQCQVSCSPRFGLCATRPDESVVSFVRSPAIGQTRSAGGTLEASYAGEVFLIKTDIQHTYPEALQYCAASTYMGLSWSLVDVRSSLAWVTSMDTRRDAYASITELGYFWVVMDQTYIDLAFDSGVACYRGAYGQPYGKDQWTHQYVPSRCSITAMVVCRASAAQNTSALVRDAAFNRTMARNWNTSVHALYVSRTFGTGPYGSGSCAFSLGMDPAVDLPRSAITVSPVLTNRTAVGNQIVGVDVSTAVQLSNDTDTVTALTGLRLRFAGAAANASGGAASSDGWRSLQLSSDEVIVAVSGCSGGFVERLVFHTNKGRLWTSPYSVSSVCSIPFLERAPNNSYLVGLRGSAGQYVENLQLVWGQPTNASMPPPPMPPSTAFADPVPSPVPSPSPAGGDDGGSSDAVAIGVGVGVGVGGAVLIAAVLGAVWWKRTQIPAAAAVAGKGGAGAEAAAGGAAGGAPGGAASTSAASSSAVQIVVDDSSKATSSALAVPSGKKSSNGEVSNTDSSRTPTTTTAGGGASGSIPTAGVSGSKSDQPMSVPSSTAPMDMSKIRSYVSEIEDRLSAYIKAGANTLDEADPAAAAAAAAGAAAGAAAAAAAPAPAKQNSPAPKTDIATAIAKLHAELSGRQEQLKITTVLGKGSSGVVYLGTWRGLRVAVKTLVVHDALLGKENRQRHRAILEAAISKSLQHPHVVNTYAAEVLPLGVVDTPAPMPAPKEGELFPEGMGDVYKLYIIQEFCEVGSLSNAISAGVVGSVAAGGAASLCALTLALDVACGMAHIHSRNIVHGDLSPSNVLLATCPRGLDGRPEVPYYMAQEDAVARRPLEGFWRPQVVAKIADFGLSVRMTESQTHASNRYQGTPAYAAPEVMSAGHLSKAADVWAFGVILLELTHGTHIRDIRGLGGEGSEGTGSSAMEALAAAATPGGPGDEAMAWAVPPPHTPPQLATLIRACVEREPGKRLTFTEVVDGLVGVLWAAHQQLGGELHTQ